MPEKMTFCAIPCSFMQRQKFYRQQRNMAVNNHGSSCVCWCEMLPNKKNFCSVTNADEFHPFPQQPFHADPTQYSTFLQSRPDVMEMEAIRTVTKLCLQYQ